MRSGQIREPQMVFDLAIQAGVLSTDEESPRYVGRYMYMSSVTFQTGGDDVADVQWWWRDGFKHRDTRRYVVNYNPRKL